MKKKLFALLLCLVMMLSVLPVIPFSAGAAGEWTEVSDYAAFNKAMTAAGTAKIKLMKNIEKKIDPTKNEFSRDYELTVSGNKTVDLNGHELLYNDNSNADGAHDGNMSVQANCDRTFIKVPKGASLTIRDSGNGGKIRTSGYYIGMTNESFGFYWDFYMDVCFRDAIHVEGKLTVESGTIEAGGSKAQYLDQFGLRVDGKQVSVGKTAYHVIRGTAVTVATGGEFISLGGEYRGHMTPTIALEDNSKTFWFNGTVCAQCSSDCFKVKKEARLLVTSGSFETYYHQYVRGTDWVPGVDASATAKEKATAVEVLRSSGYAGIGTPGVHQSANTYDYGHIGIPADSFAANATVNQNGKDEYDPNWKGNTTVTPPKTVTDASVGFVGTDENQIEYISGTDCAAIAEIPAYYAYAGETDCYSKVYIWDLLEETTPGKWKQAELTSNDKTTITRYTNQFSLQELASFVKGGLKSGTKYRLRCSVQEGFSNGNVPTVLHKYVSGGTFTVVSVKTINTVTATGTIGQGSKLTQSGPIQVSKTGGISSATVVYESNGQTLKDGTTVTFGDYGASIYVTAGSGCVFSSGTTLSWSGMQIKPTEVSQNGAAATFRLPAVRVDCAHSSWQWGNNGNVHWKYCKLCQTKFDYGDHKWNKGVVSGKTITYTCTDCGATRTGTVPETRTLIKSFVIRLPLVFEGDNQFNATDVSLGFMINNNKEYYGYATVESLTFSKSGKFGSGAVDATIVLKAASNYYFNAADTFPSSVDEGIFQRDIKSKTPSSDGTKYTVVYTISPIKKQSGSVTLPTFTVGKTFSEVYSEIKASVNGSKYAESAVVTISKGSTTLFAFMDERMSESSANITFTTGNINSFGSMKVEPDTEYTFTYFVATENTLVQDVEIKNAAGWTGLETGAKSIGFQVSGKYRTPKNEINVVTVTGIPAPEAGVTNNAPKAVPEDSYYSVSGAKFNCDGAFKCGKAYVLTVTLKAAENFKFGAKDGILAVIDGHIARVTKVSTDAKTLTVEYTYPEVGHKEITVTKEATCTEEGNTEIKCEVCGETLANGIEPKLDHTYTLVEEVPATCCDEGVKAYCICDSCGGIFDSDKNPITEKELTIPKDPTNHVGGDMMCDEHVHYIECACGSHLDEKEHVFDDWVIDAEPTEENEGVRHKTCPECGYTVNEPVPYTGEKKPATTTAPGTAAEPATSMTTEAPQEDEDGGRILLWIILALILIAAIVAAILILNKKKKKK